MRSKFNPHSSAAHKLACLSLYRALLKQSLRFSEQSTTTALINLIRHRFHLDQSITSQQVICDALKKGRQALTVIYTATHGSSTALAQIASTLDQVAKHASDLANLRTHQNSLRSPTRPGKLPKIAHVRGDGSKFWAERIPNPIPVLNRPVPKEQLPNPENPRRVPILANFQGVPFLRYKAGAQSPKLTRILGDVYERSLRKRDMENRLTMEIEHAHLEDDWDRYVFKQTGYREPMDTLLEDGRWSHRVKSWAEDTRAAQQELQQSMKEASSRRNAMTYKMWDIIQKEKQLAEKEKAERKAKRRLEREQVQGQEGDAVALGDVGSI